MRPMDQITGKEQKRHVILHYLLNQQMTATKGVLQQSVVVTGEDEGGDGIRIELTEPWELLPNDTIVLAKVLARYVELQCSFIRFLGPTQVQLKVEKVMIAKKDRANPRIVVRDEGLVNVTNIVSSKTIIEANMFNIPTLVRVNFDDYKKRLNLRSGEMGVLDVFKSDLERKFEVVKTTQKTLYLADLTKEESYQSLEEDLVHFEDEVDEQISKYTRLAKDRQLKSELLLPVLYTNELDEIIPIGYYHLVTKEKYITKEDVSFYQTLIKEMIERIKDANLMTTAQKFPVLDVSVSGIRLRVNHPNLVETLPKQKGFLLELVFKLQSPFKFFGKIAWAKKDPTGDLLVGVEFTGKQRTYSEKVRFEENLEILKSSAEPIA